MRRYSLIGCFIAALLAFPAYVHGKEEQKLLGTFGVWKTYSYQENGTSVCYMVKPMHFSKTGKFKRGPAYLMITQRPSENSTDVISYTSGYNFKNPSSVTITVGKNTFDLFTQKDTAWSRDSKTDHALSAAIRSSATLKAQGFPSDTKYMTSITDTLDLKGAAQAYQAIGIACGLVKAPAPKKAAKSAPKAAKKH